MPESHLGAKSQIFSPGEKLAIAAAAIGAFALGYVGYDLHYQNAGLTPSTSDLLYNAFSLFLIQFYGNPVSVPWQLDVARWLAPASLSYAAARAIAASMSDRFARMRMRRLSAHAILCGLDSASLQILRSARAAGLRVVVIAREDNRLLGEARSCGAFIIPANPTDTTQLAGAGLKRAAYLFAVSDNDAANTEIAYHALQQRAATGNEPALKCALHIESRKLASALYAHPAFAQDCKSYSASLFNQHQLRVRALLDRHGPEQEIASHVADGRPLSILMLGDYGLLDELILHMANIGHYGQEGLLDIHCAGKIAASRVAALLEERPALPSLLKLSAHAVDVQVFNADASEQLLNGVQPNIVYVCAERIEQTLIWTRALMVLNVQCPVVVCDTSTTRMHEMLLQEFKPYDNVSIVSLVAEGLGFQTVAYASQDRMARLIHENYVESQRLEGKTPEDNPSMKSWSEISETLKDANRNQADHNRIKCRLLAGTDSYSADTIDTLLTPRAVERLAILEHERWMAEKLLAGWRQSAEGKDEESLRTDCLVPWNALLEEQRERDRAAVRNMPDLLRELGEASVSDE